MARKPSRSEDRSLELKLVFFWIGMSLGLNGPCPVYLITLVSSYGLNYSFEKSLSSMFRSSRFFVSMRSGDGGRPPNVILISSSQMAICANYYLFGPAVAVAFLLPLLLVDDEDGAFCSMMRC